MLTGLATFFSKRQKGVLVYLHQGAVAIVDLARRLSQGSANAPGQFPFHPPSAAVTTRGTGGEGCKEG